MDRRSFIKTGLAASGSLVFAGCNGNSVPSYLKDHADLYRQDAKIGALRWFEEARFGLFMHYGLYSILARGEWVMLRERIPVKEYEQLTEQFNPVNFDADFITDLALEAEMKYINITSKHHDGFALFDTRQNDYCSPKSAAQRDLIADLAEQCQQKGLGLFLYYSYAADWRHPYFYSRDAGWKNARPAYEQVPEQYKWEKDEDFQIYVDFVHSQLREILTQYGPLAGVWFDPIMGFYSRPDLFPMEETYALVRSLQPQTLISFKQGATGTEDFAAPERSGHSLAERLDDPEKKRVAHAAWESNKNKHNEICDTLQPRTWGYNKNVDAEHKTPDQVMKMLDDAWAADCNLLLNTGPLPDGSIHETDVATLREVGKRRRARMS